jgi:DNA-binding transcriptional regulator/RsmH inhibitor MraZ
MELDNINPALRNYAAIQKSLGVVGRVSDFKFTNEEKSRAHAKL